MWLNTVITNPERRWLLGYKHFNVKVLIALTIRAAARRTILHITNPLHVYCRMVDYGVPKFVSFKFCCVYEKSVFRGIKAALCLVRLR
jgi:hypothetical protein